MLGPGVGTWGCAALPVICSVCAWAGPLELKSTKNDNLSLNKTPVTMYHGRGVAKRMLSVSYIGQEWREIQGMPGLGKPGHLEDLVGGTDFQE